VCKYGRFQGHRSTRSFISIKLRSDVPKALSPAARRAFALAVATLAAVALLAGAKASPAPAAITFDGSPGASAPPPTLGPYAMTPFPDDPRPDDADVLDVPNGPTGALLFSHAMRHSSIGDGWADWSHGYAGDVYTTVSQPQPESDSVTMSLPADTSALYFYAEPNNFGVFTIEARAQDGTTSGPVPVEGGASDARYFGFYATDADVIASVTVDAASSASGFAVGEFGIASLPAQPTFADTDPDSPANDNSPSVKGTAPAGSTVRLFTSDDCSGTAIATGTAEEFASPGLPASVPDGSTTTFRATATDAAGNSSGCSSSSIVYVELHADCDLVASKIYGADPPVGDGVNRPFKTVQQLADALGPGQTGCIHGYSRGSVPNAGFGLYSEDVTVANGGSSDLDRITIRSAPGEVAQVKGRLLVTGDFVTVSGLVLDGRNASDLPSPTVQGSDVVFSDNNVTSRDTVSCFQVGLNARLLRNRIRNCRIGILVGNGSSATIEENLIYDNSDEGISFEPYSQSATASKNIVDGNGRGIRFEGDSSQAAAQNQVASSIISFSRQGYNVRTTFAAQTTGSNQLTDSCLWTGSTTYSGSPPKSGIDPNAYDQGLTASGTTVANPAYANRSAKNFHITSGSPCYAQTGDIAQAVDDGGGPTDAEALNLRPNVLFIVTDDQRLAGTMAYMPKTLKWFKSGAPLSGIAGGTEFSNGFVTTSLCCPSRASILTGQYAHNHGIEVEEIAGTAFSQSPDNTLDDQYPMLQRYLDDDDPSKDLDYRTAIFGKYLNGWDPCAAFPAPTQPPHFDRYAFFSTGGYVNFTANDQGTGYGCGSTPRVATYSTTWISSGAQSFIDETETDDSRPWFMYVAPRAPHTSSGYGGESAPLPEPNKYDPSTLPSSSLGGPASNPAICESQTQLKDNPQWVRGSAGLLPDWMKAQTFKDQYPAPTVSCKTTPAAADPAREREVQLRTLKSADDLVEAIFQRLKATGEENDTLAFFISDNGWMWGEHGMHGKNRPYTDSIQVPLFMRWPGNPAVKRGVRDARLAANIDLTPTVLDALGIIPDTGNPPDGRSLLGATTHSEILAEAWHTENGVNVPFWASIRAPSYQYIESYAPPNSEQSPFREYYNLSSSPWQVVNGYGPDGKVGGGDDQGNPPLPPSARLSRYRTCKGQTCP
jgi:arylsulfatase A-like enzyme